MRPNAGADHLRALIKPQSVKLKCRAGELSVAVDIWPAFIFDCLTHARQRLCAITGHAARRVDQVLVPSAARKADLWSEQLVDVMQPLKELLANLWWELAACSLQRVVEVSCRALQMIGRILKRREVKVGDRLEW